MKKLAALSLVLVCSILLSSCSSSVDQDSSIRTFLGRWEAKEITYTENNKFIKIPYSELKEFSQNEIIEIFTDDNNSVTLTQYPVGQEEPKIYKGNYRFDTITLGGLEQKRVIANVGDNFITINTRMIINGNLTTVTIDYLKAGPPRDSEEE